MTYRAEVFVTLKPVVNDPAGLTIKGGLHALGFDSVTDVRAGKYLVVTLEAKDEDQARAMQHAGNGRARFSFSWELLDNYPRATFAVLDRAGHFVNIEQDVLCQALMREWLDRVEEYAADLDRPRLS